MTTTRLIPANQGIIRHLSFDIRKIVFPFLMAPLKNMLEFDMQAIKLRIQHYFNSPEFQSFRDKHMKHLECITFVDFDPDGTDPRKKFLKMQTKPNVLYITLFDETDKPRPYFMALCKDESMVSFSANALLELENFLFIDLLAHEREAQVLQEHHELYLVARGDFESLVHLEEKKNNIRRIISTSDATDSTKRAPHLDLEMLDAEITDFNQRYGKLVPITITLEKQINGGFVLRGQLYSFFTHDRLLTYLYRERCNLKAFIRPAKRFSFEQFSSIKIGEGLLQQINLVKTGFFAQPTPVPVVESSLLSRRSEP